MSPTRSAAALAAAASFFAAADEDDGPLGQAPFSPQPEPPLDEEERARLADHLLDGIRFLCTKSGPTVKKRLMDAFPLRPHYPRSGMSLYSPQQYDRVQYLLRSVFFLCVEDRRVLENRLMGCVSECFSSSSSSWPNASASRDEAALPATTEAVGATDAASRGKKVRFSVVVDDEEAARFGSEYDDDDGFQMSPSSCK